MASIAPHYAVEDLGSSLRFVMPYRTQWVTVGLQLASVLFLASVLALLVWAVSKMMPVKRLIFVSLPFLAVGLLALLAALTHWSVELLWQLVGKEVIDVHEGSIAIGHQVFGSRLSRSYPADSIGGVFVVPPSDNWLTAHYSPGASMFSKRRYSGDSARAKFDRGRVAVAAGKTISGEVATVRFGSSIDEEEARQVVATIHRRFPRYAPPEGQGTSPNKGQATHSAR